MKGTASAKSLTQKEVTALEACWGRCPAEIRSHTLGSQGEDAQLDSKIPECHRGILGRQRGQGARNRYIFCRSL